MNTSLNFDFVINKEKNTVNVMRDFNAELNLVWEAWTNPEILDQWWAPKPYKTQTKSMDFREGGMWLYAMVSPKNEVHWCKAQYQNIEAFKSFIHTDSFCDENGNVVQDFPTSSRTNVFKANKDKTSVNITIQYDSLADLEQVIKMGFKEGFTMAMQNLDLYLEDESSIKEIKSSI